MVTYYEDLKKHLKKEGPKKPAPVEKLRCDHCDRGGCGPARHSDSSGIPQVFCTVPQELELPENRHEGSCWVPLALARMCDGPNDLRKKLVLAFMRGDETLTPPDS